MSRFWQTLGRLAQSTWYGGRTQLYCWRNGTRCHPLNVGTPLACLGKGGASSASAPVHGFLQGSQGLHSGRCFKGLPSPWGLIPLRCFPRHAHGQRNSYSTESEGLVFLEHPRSPARPPWSGAREVSSYIMRVTWQNASTCPDQNHAEQDLTMEPEFPATDRGPPQTPLSLH